MIRLLLILSAALLFASGYVAQASNYFVDFSAGSDANNGTSTGTPWKHCPGDDNATGTPASTSLSSGDVVNFKAGVSYGGGLGSFSWNGSLGNPITLQSAAGWGTGRAIMDGSINTNSTAFLIGYFGGGNYYTINGFEIKNYRHAAVHTKGIGTVVTNNVAYRMGIGAWDISSTEGYGVYFDGAIDTVCVSNSIGDVNMKGVYVVNGARNTIVWGNTVTNAQDHGMMISPSTSGYTLIANNSIHDFTNQITHDDAIHIQAWGSGTNAVIVTGNRIWNTSQNIFLNNFMTSGGDAYVFNNVVMNAGSSGQGQDGYYNGIVLGAQSGQTNLFDNWYLFNNTAVFMNAGSGGFRIASTQNGIMLTNLWLLNNLWWNSYANGYNETNATHIYSGYNLTTNVVYGDWIATFKAAHPTLEVNSGYGNVQFANLISGSNIYASDFHLALGSAGTGAGTNLSTLLPANKFSYLPARYQVDPTKDALGVTRGSSWDIGAYQGSTNTPLYPPTGLTISSKSTLSGGVKL